MPELLRLPSSWLVAPKLNLLAPVHSPSCEQSFWKQKSKLVSLADFLQKLLRSFPDKTPRTHLTGHALISPAFLMTAPPGGYPLTSAGPGQSTPRWLPWYLRQTPLLTLHSDPCVSLPPARTGELDFAFIARHLLNEKVTSVKKIQSLSLKSELKMEYTKEES